MLSILIRFRNRATGSRGFHDAAPAWRFEEWLFAFVLIAQKKTLARVRPGSGPEEWGLGHPSGYLYSVVPERVSLAAGVSVEWPRYAPLATQTPRRGTRRCTGFLQLSF